MKNLGKFCFSALGVVAFSFGQAHAQLANPNVTITEIDGQTVFKGDGGYDQIDYDGNSGEYKFVRNADWSVSVTKPDGVTDLLINIDGFWFDAEQKWYPIEDLVKVIDSGQTIIGTPDTYDQVDYLGSAFDYNFIRNADMSVTVTKPSGNEDTLFDIDGVWFSGEKKWYSIGQLIEAFLGNRTITGNPDSYDQVDYPGAAKDYRLAENADGSVNLYKPDGGTDTLIDIDGFWFQDEERWYRLDSLLPKKDREIIGTDDYDQVDYDGFRDEHTFVQNEDGSITVYRPGGVIDTLVSIDGFWFRDEEAWYSIEDIFDESTGTVVMDDEADGTEGGDGNNDPATDDPATDDPATDDPATDDPATDDPATDDPDTGNGENTGVNNNGVITGSNDVNDNLIGDDNDNIFFAGRGFDLIRGLGGNDTLRVDGDILEWTFRAESQDRIIMTHPTWGENTLISIENIFSLRSGSPFTIDEAFAETAGLPAFRLDNDNVINGTNGDDDIPSQPGVQGFYGGLGDDTFRGTGDFEQVNYDGARSEFSFAQNADGSIGVSHPIWGNDTLINIDALIFTGVEPGVGGARTAEFEFVDVNDLF